MNASTARFQAVGSHVRGSPNAQDFDAVETRALVWALWQARWKLLGLALGAGLLVWIGMHQVTPTYTVYGKLMLDTRKAQIVGKDEVVADVSPSEQIVNSEIAVLRSNMVIERMLTSLTPGQLDQLDPALAPKSVKSRLEGFLGGMFAKAREPLSASEAALRRDARLVDAVGLMRTAYAQPDSYVMVVRVDSTDPVLARDLANGMVDAYIGLQLENRRFAVGLATGWLEERLEELRRQVEASERAVAEFQARSLILDGGTLENATQLLGDLNGELAVTRAAWVDADSRLNQLTDVLAARNMEAAARIIDTPNMQKLAAQQLELRQSDAIWARSFGAIHPRRAAIQAKLNGIQLDMQIELENAIAVRRSELALAKSKEAGIEAGIGTLEGKVMGMTDSQLGLRQLNREADAFRQTYESFLVRIAEARAQKEMQQADSVLVERAVLPEVPSKPRPTLLAALATTMTAAVVAAWVLFAEMAPKTFRSTRELGTATGLQVLTSLPDELWPNSSDMLADLKVNPYSFYAERIRQLRTTLTLRLSTTGRGQSVLILASAPGEGKTTTALALTQMAALSGRSAIIVDCDLRRPRVLSSLGMTRPLQHDFGKFIEDNCSLSDAICRPQGYDFDVLAVQEPRLSAADALSVTWLGPVLRELEGVYDFVIVDAPALLAVPDALIVAQVVETKFFLVSCNQTPRNVVQRGLATLDEMGIKVRGLILNKVDPRKSIDSLEGGYEYGYSSNETWPDVRSEGSRIGPPSGPARGNHPLLAGRDARWRKGA